ncbi:MAG TPA: hypothetical protein VFM11_06045 [Burkholderiales bacterium]|nr:hypothetical protein [Burkholderiales bacterium]
MQRPVDSLPRMRYVSLMITQQTRLCFIPAALFGLGLLLRLARA